MASSPLDFTGKRVLVTGGAQGLGEAIAKKFLELNAHVIVLDKQEKQLQEFKAKYGDRVTVGQVDLMDWEKTREAVKAVLPVHHLCNNAGVIALNPSMGTSEKEFDLVMGVNVKAVLNVSQVVASDMIQRGIKGTIVNMSSIAGEVPQGCGVGLHNGVYAISKAGINMFTKCLSSELIGYGIRVNYVSPGCCDTPFVVSNPEFYKEKLEPAVKKILGAERICPEEIANAYVYFSSPLSAKVTGTGLLVDGGYSSNLQAP